MVRSVSKKPNRRGATLGTIILLTAVVATLAFAVTSSSLTHLHLSQRSANSEVARNLAESVISLGLEKVLESNDFGTVKSETETVTVQGFEKNSGGKLTFSPETAAGWENHYSTNNIDGDGAVSGSGGRLVPKNSLHLVGSGFSNGTQRTVEAFFHVPKFPFVVATDGKFQTEGEMLIASVEQVDELLKDGPDEDALRPGHIVANSTESDALQLGSQTKVTGDAKAAGGVSLMSGAEVLGEVKPNAGLSKIPHYSVNDFDPQTTGKLGIQYLNSSVVNKPTYEGWVRRQGDLLVNNGLNLDSGVLYVDGDLVVTGGVQGTGAILVTGDTHISGRSSLSTDNVAALVSEGDVEIQGSGKGSSLFRGLIYTNKGLRAENVTVVGTLIVAGKDGELTLKDSNVVYSPDSIRIDLQHSARTALHFVAPSGANPGAYLGTRSNDKSQKNKKRIYISLNENGEFLVYPSGSDESDAQVAATVEEAIEAVRSLVAVGNDEKQLQAFEASSNPRLNTLLEGLNDKTIPLEEPEVDLLTIDPSQLVGLADKIRLVLMRDI